MAEQIETGKSVLLAVTVTEREMALIPPPARSLKEAQETGVSRSKFVRDAINFYHEHGQPNGEE